MASITHEVLDRLQGLTWRDWVVALGVAAAVGAIALGVALARLRKALAATRDRVTKLELRLDRQQRTALRTSWRDSRLLTELRASNPELTAIDWRKPE